MSEKVNAAVAALEDIKGTLTEYKNTASQMYLDRKIDGPGQTLTKLFTGTNQFDNDPIHMNYYHSIEEKTAVLEETLEALYHEDWRSSQDIAAEAVRVLTEPAGREIRFLEFILMADDQQADRLFRFMSTDDLVKLHEGFLADPGRHCSVPSQSASLEKLEALLKQRGIQLPVPSFFERLKKKLGIL